MKEGYYSDLIEKELLAAGDARKQGIEGRARVSARRAAGFAIAWLYASRGQQVRENDSLNLLRTLEGDESIPSEVRGASERLTTKITPDFKYSFAADPLDDARMIVDYVKQHLA